MKDRYEFQCLYYNTATFQNPKTYTFLSMKHHQCTMMIGAKCSDGVVLVADKKLTDIFDRLPPEFTNKLSGHTTFSYGIYRVARNIRYFQKSDSRRLVANVKQRPIYLRYLRK